MGTHTSIKAYEGEENSFKTKYCKKEAMKQIIDNASINELEKVFKTFVNYNKYSDVTYISALLDC